MRWNGNIIDGEFFSKMCDYSLGDQSGLHNTFPNHNFEEANMENKKLVKFLNFISTQPAPCRVVTIFIDTVRLAGLMPLRYKEDDYPYLKKLVEDNNLFRVIEKFPEINFIVFCHLEDSELDSRVIPLIPKNVLTIYTTHAFATDGRIRALPNGVQRARTARGHQLLEKYIQIRGRDYVRRARLSLKFTQLLYVNINTKTHPSRANLVRNFQSKKWAKVEAQVPYQKFLIQLHRFPFTLAPQGMALGDTHREWEAVYLGSVPVVEATSYLRKLYRDIPVVSVDDLKELTLVDLRASLHLVEQLRHLDLSALDANRIFANAVVSSLNSKTSTVERF
jgi:hypothetical protein